MSNHKKGFTLVELLVVIAIIGILSSVVFASLTSARGKARVAAAQQTMGSLNALATMCANETTVVDLTTPAAGSDVCGANDGNATYPTLPAGWSYGCGTDTPTQDLTLADGAYAVCAQSTSDAAEITCTPSGCVKDATL